MKTVIAGLIGAGLVAGIASEAWGQALAVVSVEPPARSNGVPVMLPIVIEFDRPLQTATVNNDSFRVFGRWTGSIDGTVTFSNNNRRVTLTPGEPMFAGDVVMVVLSHDIRAVDGQFLRSAGYSFQFRTRAEPAEIDLDELDEFSTRSDCCTETRAYGGVGTDYNNDGWADVSVVNEISADLRVFLNTTDGSGYVFDFIQPTSPIGNIASPNEPADFDNDGNADLCVANDGSNTISVLLGNGDGTFQPHDEIPVGQTPRGITVLDADGDGDIDIVNGNANGDNLSLLVNNGNGQFIAAPVFFGSGTQQEWGVSANDMNNDGILDLVVLGRLDEKVAVLTGNGNGTFSIESIQDSGGGSRTLAVGDLDNDGDEDVVVANGTTNNIGVLLGDGDGSLGAPAIIPTHPFTGSVDLGDLDGDGDLDLVISSFNGDWQFYVNNGSGAFAFDQTVNAPQVASCSVLVDMDNDRDLDAVLIDELEDSFKVIINSGSTVSGDIDRDGGVDINDLFEIIQGWGPCDAMPAPCPADISGNGLVNIDDLFQVIAGWQSV